MLKKKLFNCSTVQLFALGGIQICAESNENQGFTIFFLFAHCPLLLPISHAQPSKLGQVLSAFLFAYLWFWGKRHTKKRRITKQITTSFIWISVRLSVILGQKTQKCGLHSSTIPRYHQTPNMKYPSKSPRHVSLQHVVRGKTTCCVCGFNVLRNARPKVFPSIKKHLKLKVLIFSVFFFHIFRKSCKFAVW